jgi:hypothetical protein
MKTLSVAMALLVSGSLLVQGQNARNKADLQSSSRPGAVAETEYRVVDRGPHHRVWQRETIEVGPDGTLSANRHKYTELATGLHYKNAKGEWVDAKEEFELKPGKAIARQGQHKVTLNYNLNSAGAVELVTPDGIMLKSHVLGLSYFDTGSGKSVLIAEVKDCAGRVAGNQVVYEDAFTDFPADVRYTYTRAGFEQDIILREQPPKPEEYGLNPETTRLQVLTEFLDAPEPGQKTRAPGKSGKSGQPEELSDAQLTFGQMQMVPGKAFSTDTSTRPANRARMIPVSKSWGHLEGRTFLLEDVSLEKLRPELEKLPAPAHASAMMPSGNTMRPVVSAKRLLPPTRLAHTGTNTLQLAKTDYQPSGLVLDYQTVNTDQTDYTFRGDTTYYISGSVHLAGLTTFEGGTILKYQPSMNDGLVINGPIECKTGPYRPAIFTSIDDDSVGGWIDGSTGSPSPGYCWFISGNYDGDWELNHVRMLYAEDFIIRFMSSGTTTIRNSQFLYSTAGLEGDTLVFRNVLVSGCSLVQGYNLSFENVTFRNTEIDLFSGPAYATNSIFDGCRFYGDGLDGINNAFSGDFQTVGNGSYYLANGSSYRDAGTTDIDPQLLADLRKKTTYPPCIPAPIFSTATNFSIKAQRDTDVPDLGYHYDSLDYVFSGAYAYSNVTVTAGTAIGWYDGGRVNCGLALAKDNIVLTFDGTVTQPCIFAGITAVQEDQTFTCNAAGIVGNGIHNDRTYAPQVNAQYLHASLLQRGNFFRDAGTPILVHANNCEFGGGGISGGLNGRTMELYLTNCLVDRSSISAGSPQTLTSVIWMRNCTMAGGNLKTSHKSGTTWPVWIQNCAFDGTTFSVDDPSGGNPNILYCNYNAFLTNAPRLPLRPGNKDVLVTNFSWQTGQWGHFYEPTNSPLIDKGSTTADLLGLCQFTTQTNQVPETNSVVDIGYHYLAPGSLWVSTNATPEELAQMLVPSWVTVANVKYTGTNVARGIFAGGFSSGFPIDSGVIFSSGPIMNAIGPNNDDGMNNYNGDQGPSNLQQPGDTNLSQLLQVQFEVIHDAAVLEFDIISPNSFALQIPYIFASEEYPEYIGPFNDPMAIFVTTNHMGTNWSIIATNDNIAWVPGTTNVPVSVNNINGGCVINRFGGTDSPTNPQFYVDNHDPNYSAMPPYAAAAPVYNIQYDGTTVLLTAGTNISANVTYHIKIAIADYLDSSFDSAVFIKAKSPVIPPCP